MEISELVFPVNTVPPGFSMFVDFFLIYNHPKIDNTPKTISMSTTGTTIAVTFVFFFFVLSRLIDVVVVVFEIKEVTVVVVVSKVGVTMQHFPLYPQNFSWSGLNVLLQYLMHHSQPKRLLQSSEFLKQKNQM